VREGSRLIGIQELWNVGGETVPGLLKHPKGEAATPAEVRAWVEAVEELRSSRGDLKTFRNGELYRSFVKNGDVSTMRVDVVGYNALGNVLTEKSVPTLAEAGPTNGKRKVIVEGANLAETAEGAKALDKLRGRLLTVPGDLANLGGVHVSNLEALQNRYGEVVTNEEARRSLEETVRSGWERAAELSERHGVSMRKAIELLSAEELMKRSLQRPDATRNSLERGVISEEARARYETRAAAQSPEALERTLARLAPFRRADGTVKWAAARRGGALVAEGVGGTAHFALALFLKEVAVVAATGDRARIEEFFDSLATTDFYVHYGLFVTGARAADLAYTRYLQRYVKPQFVNGLLKTNLVLAAGLALPMIVEGQFSGKTFAISLTSLGLSSAAVRSGVAGIRWVMDLKRAQSTGALGRVGASAGRLARLGGWFYTAAELAVILYVAEEIDERIHDYLDLRAARDAIGDASRDLVAALDDPTVSAADAEEAARAYGEAWTAYRNFLYHPLEEDEEVFAGRMEKLAREAKLAADKRAVTLAKLEDHPALKASALRRYGSLEAYAAALRAEDEEALADDLATAMRSYEANRAEHLREVYEDGRREGALLGGLDHAEWLFDGAPRGAANDPWGTRNDAFARWGRSRSRSSLRDVFGDASTNRLQTYDDEAEVLAALAARLRARGQGEAADALDGRRERVALLQDVDARLVRGDGLVAPLSGAGGLGDRVEDAVGAGAR
jgi:hypothetical protein